MKRADRALREAPDRATLRRLPRTELVGTVYREHADRPDGDRGCWWFASTSRGGEPGGRFDLPAPRGTLYVAETPSAAARERCGRFLAAHVPIPEGLVVGRVVSAVMGACSDLGDLTDPGAAAVGVTGEIHTVDDYRLTTSWSSAADALGLAGLKYMPRFTPGSEAAYALFGAEGPFVPRGFAVVGVQALAEVLVEMGVFPRALPRKADAVDDAAEVDEG